MASEYRYGYQSSECDPEVKGEGNSYTTEYRQLDSRLGRWLSIDPKASSMPWQSPYVSMDNNPIMYNDPFGDSIRTNFKTVLANKSLEAMAKTDEGYNLLAKFAYAGQKIGDVTFDEDGEYHKAKIDLILTDKLDEDSGGAGTTEAKGRIVEKRLKIDINLNSGNYGYDLANYRKGAEQNLYKSNPELWKKYWNQAMGSKIQTLFHEITIHGFDRVRDFQDDGKLNSYPTDAGHKHHLTFNSKVGVDVRYDIKNGIYTPVLINKTNESLFLYNAFKGLQEYHKMYKTDVTDKEIYDRMMYGIEKLY